MIPLSETIAGGKKSALSEIQSACAELAGFRSRLRTHNEARVNEINAINQRFAPELRALQEKCSATRAELAALIEQNRSLFKDPKTREFYSITVGFEKNRDALEYPADEILVSRIQEMLPKAQQDLVLKKTTEVLRKPLKSLGQKILQKLGITKKLGADAVVIRGDDDDIETLVQKSIGEPAKTEVQS